MANPQSGLLPRIAGTSTAVLIVAVLLGWLSPGDAFSFGIWGGLVAHHAHQVLRVPDPFGRKVTARTIVSSYVLMALNPFFLLQNVLLVVGNTMASLRRLVTRIGGSGDSTQCSPPFEGQWYVLNGGSTKVDSHSWYLLSQRYAYDFIRPPRPEDRNTESLTRLEDYPAFDAAVVSPGTGVVIRVRDGTPDSLWIGRKSGWIPPRFVDLRGNHVVIRLNEGHFTAYALLAHLKKDSIVVRKGQRVSIGDPIGRCGNSGFTTEPHIHFHLQDSRYLYWAIGLPVRFRAAAMNAPTSGAIVVKKGDPLHGVRADQ